MVKNAVRDYGVKRNERKTQAKNIFNKVWDKLINEKKLVFEMNIETSSILEDLINSEMIKLKEHNPHLFEDFYKNHDLEIVRLLFNDLLNCIENNVKLKDELEEYKLENKRINKKLDEVKKDINNHLRDVKNDYINISNHYLEKYFGK